MTLRRRPLTGRRFPRLQPKPSCTAPRFIASNRPSAVLGDRAILVSGDGDRHILLRTLLSSAASRLGLRHLCSRRVGASLRTVGFDLRCRDRCGADCGQSCVPAHQPLVVPISQITELKSHPNSNGRMTRFEIWTGLGRTVQMHMFQANFLAGVSAVRAARADLTEQVLDSWSL